LEKKEWERTEKIRIAKEMEEERIKVDKEQEIEADRLEKEIVEQNRLKPDKEKILQLANTLEKIPFPSLNTKKGEELLMEIDRRITKLANGIRSHANKL